MKKTSKVAVATLPAKITTTELESAGIKTNLNQNDIVEILAEEHYNSVMKNIERLNNRVLELHKKYQDLTKTEAEKFIHDLNKLKITSINTTEPDFHGCIQRTLSNKKSYKFLNILDINVRDRTDNSHTFQTNQNYNSFPIPPKNDNIPVELSYTIENSVNTTKLGIEVLEHTNTHFHKTVIIKNKAMTDLIKEVEAHNEEVTQTLKMFKQSGNHSYQYTFSMNEITRTIKNKVNKNIIKSQAPNIQAQLEQLFNISL